MGAGGANGRGILSAIGVIRIGRCQSYLSLTNHPVIGLIVITQ